MGISNDIKKREVIYYDVSPAVSRLTKAYCSIAIVTASGKGLTVCSAESRKHKPPPKNRRAY